MEFWLLELEEEGAATGGQNPFWNSSSLGSRCKLELGPAVRLLACLLALLLAAIKGLLGCNQGWQQIGKDLYTKVAAGRKELRTCKPLPLFSPLLSA